MLCYDLSLLAINGNTVTDNILRSIIGATRILTAKQDTVYQLLLRYIHIYHHIYRQTILCQDTVKLLSLSRCSRETIEDITYSILMLCHIVTNHADND